LVLGTAFASVIALAVGMRPAAAATTSGTYEFDFAPFDQGPEAHCMIHIQADFPFNGIRNSGRGMTSVTGDSSACTSGVTTTVAADYRDTTDTFVSRPYNAALASSVSHTWTDVNVDFQTYHDVYFAQCGCNWGVHVLSTPNPK
jgi:hypothetical protein